MKPFIFPKGFLFGSATAGAQVEGGDKNSNWYDWAQKGHIKDGSDILRTGDHWNRYREDISLLNQMHHQVYRMGIEWSRIEPQEGHFDEQAIQHYRDMLIRLNENHIRPLVTLFHFTYPIWLDKIGGFESKKVIPLFKRYVRFVVERLGDLVSEFITINEPNVLMLNGYVIGIWPPGKKSLKAGY
ncbi:MAG TPA: glycoside hydrolase family 1 protein, partial [Ruminococcaceae bacterium]|nr:glycoside hydrolase family 1 protein [Oscillospiraceae bacterium]